MTTIPFKRTGRICENAGRKLVKLYKIQPAQQFGEKTLEELETLDSQEYFPKYRILRIFS